MIVQCFDCRQFLFIEDKMVNLVVCACGCRCFGWDDHTSSMTLKRTDKDNRPIVMAAPAA